MIKDAWAQAPGKIIATAIVLIVLLSIAIPAAISSSREKSYRKVIRRIMSFQAAAARFQNDSPSLKFFSDIEDINRSGFQHLENDSSYNFFYLTDKTRTKFCYLAVPDLNNGDTKAFLGDETGRIYTCAVEGELRKQLSPDELGDAVQFNKEPENRLPGDWLPL